MDEFTERNAHNPGRGSYWATKLSDLSSRKRKRIIADQKDHFDPFSLSYMIEELNSGKFGSLAKDIQELAIRRQQLLNSFYGRNHELPSECLDMEKRTKRMVCILALSNVIDKDDDLNGSNAAGQMFVPAAQQSNAPEPIVITDSDDGTDSADQMFFPAPQQFNVPEPIVITDSDDGTDGAGQILVPAAHQSNASEPIVITDSDDGTDAAGEMFVPAAQQYSACEPVVVTDSNDGTDANSEMLKPLHVQADFHRPHPTVPMKDIAEHDYTQNQSSQLAEAHVFREPEPMNSESESVGSEDGMQEESDDLADAKDDLDCIWNEMTVALECEKDVTKDPLLDEHEDEDEEVCEHSFIFKDDIGDVCRICGVIQRKIETIIEYNFLKGTKSSRTYRYEGRRIREREDETVTENLKLPMNDIFPTEIYPHPWHMREMKPHQIEGFNFLANNLVSDNPGGCIIAHAPGSGKTFMIISFLQSFMTKYANARPLVVLPRGILPVWKKEFHRWQVENIPLYDFYSVRADSRAQQCEVLEEWVEKRSILFLGYKQFSSIIYDEGNGKIASACRNYLLTVPSILILDEGHTPRNPETDTLSSLDRVETTRKVVLSGTLYQNNVREVFSIINLVRPKFLKMETSKAIRIRIMSRAEISNRRNLNLMKSGRDNDFYDCIEHSLLDDENHKRKVAVIQDLREMTRNVLHYYKGDNLYELPGLLDFTVFLQLSPAQKSEVKELKFLSGRFQMNAQGSAIYVHPKLKAIAKTSGAVEEKIDALVEKLDVRDSAKLTFYLNLLQSCESSDEKLLVFSQYLLPLKFLERLTSKIKGYSIGREMFMITGDLDNEKRESYMEKFNKSCEARVFFGSIKACGEGISLVGASRIIILDVHLNPSITRQAIGRAFRPGQVRKVYTYRLIASGSIEEEDHDVCFKKESIAKMWFEWDECSGHQNYEMKRVDINDCGDMFLETMQFKENVVALLKR